MEVKVEIFQVWKIMENDLRHGKVVESVTSNLENSDAHYVRVEHLVVEQSGIRASVRLAQLCPKMLLLSSFWNTVAIKDFFTL